RARNRNLTVCVSARQGSSISVDGLGENRPDPLQMERRAACPELAEGSSPVVAPGSPPRAKIRDYNGFSSYAVMGSILFPTRIMLVGGLSSLLLGPYFCPAQQRNAAPKAAAEPVSTHVGKGYDA